MQSILIIEDNLAMRENTAEMLDLSGYKTYTAVNGREGVQMALDLIPELILCDIMMPDLDGYGVLKMLNKHPETASIPFIFLTAKAEKSDVRKGMNLGADDYLTKPFEEVDLLDAIETRLTRHNIFKKEFSPDYEGLNQFISEARALKELESLTEQRNTRTYNKKENLFNEGEYPHFLYFIISGKVKSIKSQGYKKDLVVDLFKAGDFIGYLPLLEEGKYSETATALETTEVAIIPTEDFLALIKSNRDVSHRFIKILTNNIKEKEEKLLQAAYSTVRERVAGAIVEIYNTFNNKEGDDKTINISRDDLASVVGTATESLIRILSSFKEDGLIEIRGRAITIVDLEGLEKIVV